MDNNNSMTKAPQSLEEQRLAMLLRQVETKVKMEGKDSDNASAVSFGKLVSTADGGEKCRLYIGWLFAGLTGGVLPVFFMIIGPVFDSFGQKTPEETLDEVTDLCLILVYLSIGIAVTSFFQNYLLISTGASISARLKGQYLAAILG